MTRTQESRPIPRSDLLGPGEDRATQPTWTSDGRILFTYVIGEHDETQRPAFISADGTGLEILDGLENLVYPRLRPTK